MRETPRKDGLTVGELAKRTGVSVRTLHHYHQIGLLSPAGRTESGYRLYDAPEIARLQQIVSLRQLGFPLAEIGRVLARPDYSATRVLSLHVGRLREQIAAETRLCDRIEALASQLRATGEATVEELLQLIEEATRMEKYYTPEQLEELRKRAESVGDERMRQVETEWQDLMVAVQAEMAKRTDPSDERVQRLAQKWSALVREFTGGNPGTEKSLRNLYEGELTVHGMDTGPMREMAAYIQKALEWSR